MRYVSVSLLCSFLFPAALQAREYTYNRDVRPILSEHCFACHGPDARARKAKLRLDLEEAAVESGAIVPGSADKSELVYRVTVDDADDIMPPPEAHNPLTPKQIETLVGWIEQGAAYEPHWSFIAPEKAAVPERGHENPIDNFIDAAAQAQGLELSPPAPSHTLARRLHFDLTGLPPSRQEAAAFSHQDLQTRAEELLARPGFGERMAVHWLDLARYADTVGYHGDQERDVSPYRDYVIDSFNANKPYDEFVTEQLAGDLLPEPTRENYIASSFNRVNQISSEGGIQNDEYIAKYYAERVRTVSVAFLGSTMGCAECHDHKFDPFTSKDFYAMQAFFADLLEKGAYTGDGSYNEGVDFKDYPGFSDSPWGPMMKVPTAAQEVELEQLSARREEARAQLEATTPDLTDAFDDWLGELRGQLRTDKPVETTILDDREMSLSDGPDLVKEPVRSGEIARRQRSSSLIQHIVNVEKADVTVAEDDVFFAWVWLDRADPTRQVMLQFHAADGSEWNHRAYWGGDHIPYGKGSTGADHFHAGKLPPRETWHRLEVSAKDVGLSPGTKITQMAFTQFGGTVVWDLTGRLTNARSGVLAKLPDSSRELLSDNPDAALTDAQRNDLLALFRKETPLLDEARRTIAETDAREKELRSQMRSTLVSLPAQPREVRVLPRGNWMDRSGPVVMPAVPEFLPGMANESGRSLTRLDLAKWITSRENPLTARTFVNRIWSLFFGTGLSRDLQDLGNQGEWPTHPELLDWLAVDFMENGWDIRRLITLIVTSKTYRQSSHTSDELRESDPYNQWYARQNARRLPAEFVRDNALSVSGLLSRKMGGPSVRPYQPAGYYSELNFPKREYQPSVGEDQYRRGVYTHWQRTFLHPMLAAFDAPPREECTAERAVSNTPLQSLTLLNDPSFVEAARGLAERMMREPAGPSPEERLVWAFETVLARAPESRELELATAFFDKQLKRYQEAPEDAEALLGVGLRPKPEDLPPVELAAYTAAARALLNLHETITRY